MYRTTTCVDCRMRSTIYCRAKSDSYNIWLQSQCSHIQIPSECITHTHLPLTDVCLDTWDCEYQIALSKHTTGAEYTISYRTSAHFGSPVQREPTEQHVKLPSNKWVWRHLTHGPAIVRLKNCVKSQYWSLTRPRKWFTECLRRGFSSERLTDGRTDRRNDPDTDAADLFWPFTVLSSSTSTILNPTITVFVDLQQHWFTLVWPTLIGSRAKMMLFL